MIDQKPDAASLRALSESHRSDGYVLLHAESARYLADKLDALDAAERERDRLDAALRASCIDAREELREMGGGCSRAVAAEAERDALVALLHRARDTLHECGLRNEIAAALAARGK